VNSQEFYVSSAAKGVRDLGDAVDVLDKAPVGRCPDLAGTCDRWDSVFS
jgi:hypothetical protein